MNGARAVVTVGRVNADGRQRQLFGVTELSESYVAQSSPALIFADDRGREGA
jgi:hypothetical protein